MICAPFALILLGLTEILAHIFAPRWNSLFESLWSETQVDLVAALREISHVTHVFAPFHRRCAQPQNGVLPVHQLFATLPKRHQGVDRWYWKFPKCQRAPMLWDKRWCFESETPQNAIERKMTCKKDATFLSLMNLAVWHPWWNAEARSDVLVQWIALVLSKLVEPGQFPARPSKISIEWCGWALRSIVFGVVVEIFPNDLPKELRHSHLLSLGMSRVSDPNSICCVPQWPYLSDSFGHLPWNRFCLAAWHNKGWCQCIELRFSYAVEWVGTCWPHEHCLKMLGTFYGQRQLLVLCVTRGPRIVTTYTYTHRYHRSHVVYVPRLGKSSMIKSAYFKL